MRSKKIRRTNKTRDDLHEALAHLRYTIDQLISIDYWNLLQKKMPLDETQKTIFSNACMESSLVSLRILNEFFKPERTKDRITASQYPHYSTPGPFLSEADVQHINDHLGHLTWRRIHDNTDQWQHRFLDSALLTCKHFLTYLRTGFLTEADREFAPISQELYAIEHYFKRTGKA
jgi:hypothetical protein